jgi:Copper type II ascorbate-dependent monooxygenase, C-terminal domain
MKMKSILLVLSIFILYFFIQCKIEDEKHAKIILPANINFAEHVAPIVFKNCTPCHRANMAAPFPLITYNDVFRKLKTVRLVLAEKYMPPWPADTLYSRFKNEKVLSELELAIFLNWIDSGAKPGDLAAIKFAPDTNHISLLGKPDLVLNFLDTVQLSGNGSDNFFAVKIPFELPNNQAIKAIEFVPGNRKLVHHVNGHLINYKNGERGNIFSGKSYLDSEKNSSMQVYQSLDLANDDGSYPTLTASAFNFLPGVEPIIYPKGIGGTYLTKKNAFLLKSIHYGPSAVDTFDLSSINIFFADHIPERPLKELHLGTLGISPIYPDFVIPADSISSFETAYTTDVDISVLTVNPHMHLLGKTFEAYVITKEGVKIPLIRINKWDFRWQYFYTFQKMLKVPAGAKIIVKATFDNTVKNVNNPFSPPKTIYPSGGEMKTTDEMFQFFIDYIPYKNGDENISL